ncbi:MAG: ribonuclease-3 [Myxococcota bacterium]|jgi:ribonuclease-3
MTDLPAVIERLRHHWTAEGSDALFAAALTRRAYLLEKKQPGGRHHEPLEWLGDRVLNLVVAQGLWHRFPFAEPGRLDISRARLIGEPLLAEVGRALGLPNGVRMGKGESEQAQAATDRALADHVEALVGAAFLAGGAVGAEALINACFEGRWPEVLPEATADGGGLADPMSQLNRIVQKRWGRSLDKSAWAVVQEGPDNARTFAATVTLPDERSFTGKPHRGKMKVAKANAAEVAVAALKQDPSDGAS